MAIHRPAEASCCRCLNTADESRGMFYQSTCGYFFALYYVHVSSTYQFVTEISMLQTLSTYTICMKDVLNIVRGFHKIFIDITDSIVSNIIGLHSTSETLFLLPN